MCFESNALSYVTFITFICNTYVCLFLVLDVSRSVGNNNNWSISTGVSKTSDTAPDVILSYDPSAQKYFMAGPVEIYSQKELVDQLGISPLSKSYRKEFPELTKFPFKNMSFKMEISKEGADFAK